ncbi:hypothetical protein KJ910_00705 [Patescibacteria group bacterium]|nr:hypothetical protein [Patescibacteria group bacterium]MBU1907193.1 hypothetical protein [Patescibacteria group bacterium]
MAVTEVHGDLVSLEEAQRLVLRTDLCEGEILPLFSLQLTFDDLLEQSLDLIFGFLSRVHG